MPAIKVERDDGPHCFNCNARVEREAARCPGCGAEFAEPARDPAPGPRPGLAERIRARSNRSIGRAAFWRAVAVLGLLALVMLVLRPPRRAGPVPEPPAAPRPEFSVRRVDRQPTRGHGRLSIYIDAPKGLADEGLRAVIDWALYDALAEHNREQRENVRVAWLYLYDRPETAPSQWRAMAIWTDPALPAPARPSGIGGDAVKTGAMQYDFTNTVNPPRGD